MSFLTGTDDQDLLGVDDQNLTNGAPYTGLNVEDTIISQYANSPTLRQMIQNLSVYLDQGANIDAFYDLVWNVATAQGYGLDVWGRIVGVQRVLQVSSGIYFGFAEAADNTETPFNVAPFYSGQTTTSNFALTDPAFQTLIFAKAAANICDGSIPAINNILMSLFGSQGNAYVTDLGAMRMTFTFDFTLSPVDFAIISQSGVLPKPSGVTLSIVQP